MPKHIIQCVYCGKQKKPRFIDEDCQYCEDCEEQANNIGINDHDIDEAIAGAPFDDDEELFPNEFEPNSNDPEDLLP
jgi:hypothetical protein